MRALLAAVQCDKGALTRNLAMHVRLLDEAARRGGCDIAVFPEMSLTGSVEPRSHPEDAIVMGDDAVGALARATDSGVAALFGIAERRGGEFFITQVYAPRRTGCRLVPEAPSRRGRRRLHVGRHACGLRTAGRGLRRRDLCGGRCRLPVRRSRLVPARASCSSAPRRGSTRAAPTRRGGVLASRGWEASGLGDARRHARDNKILGRGSRPRQGAPETRSSPALRPW